MELLGRRNLNLDGADEHIYVEEWVILTRSIAIFLTESRLIVFLYNLVSLSLTLMILKGVTISTSITALLMIGMLPYYVGFTLLPILYVGKKKLNIRGDDFRRVFLGWTSILNVYAQPIGAQVRKWLGLRPMNESESRVCTPMMKRFIPLPWVQRRSHPFFPEETGRRVGPVVSSDSMVESDDMSSWPSDSYADETNAVDIVIVEEEE